MLKPSFSEFMTMAKQGNLIPVYKKFLADTETPVSAYLKLRDKSYSYLLESADGGNRWGRYSFIGYKPFLTVLSYDREMEIRNGQESKILKDVVNPIDVLREINDQFKPVNVNGLPPFQGGLVGCFNYDLIRKWERLPGIQPDNPNLPESIFTASRRMVIFDHLTHKIIVAAFAYLEDDRNLLSAYTRACQEVDETLKDLQRPLSAALDNDTVHVSELQPNMEKKTFEDIVVKAKEHIKAGDVIQVVLSQKLSGSLSGEPFKLYRNLRSINPSPYMFYLNFEDVKLIGASPEILIRLTDGLIELRPIAGTRPRGETPDADRSFGEELLADPKEKAEHIMLVDLGRNDVGKVSMPGSVIVPRLMEIERYSHVMHIVSRVEGTLKDDMDSFDLFMSAFPAGTVSGAPKIRAMEIISELEPAARGSYAGAVGYFGFNGNMDFCITIRTIAVTDGHLSIQVGAGIVADSTPAGEYVETIKKATAMIQSIKEAGIHDTYDR
ncbi:MAG: anthranilate synthase component I [Deltaproteobacteria bacterium]|nr:anthranilate synthase component I [Deltaproteobacteria bacterium]